MSVVWAGTAIALAAGFVQGLTGFGFALVFTPLMLALLAPREAVVASLLLGTPLSLAVLWETRRDVERRVVLAMVAAAAVGTPVGIAALLLMSSHVLRWGIVLASALGAALFFLRPRGRTTTRVNASVAAAASFVGGFFNATTSMGGPPVALVVAAQGWPTQAARGSLAAFNLLSYVVALAGFAMNHIVHGSLVAMAAIWLMPAAIGALAGSLVGRRVPRRYFPTVLVVTVLVSLTFATYSLL